MSRKRSRSMTSFYEPDTPKYQPLCEYDADQEKYVKKKKGTKEDLIIDTLMTNCSINDNYYEYVCISSYNCINNKPYVKVYWRGYTFPTWEPLSSFDVVPKEEIIACSKTSALTGMISFAIKNHQINDNGDVVYTCLTNGLTEDYSWTLDMFELKYDLCDIKNYIHYNNKFPHKVNYIYVRVSTLAQNGLNNVSLDSQIATIMLGIVDKNTPCIIVREIGSAYNKSQPKLKKIIDLLRKNDAIYVYSTDRFSRNLLSGINFINQINNNNASLYIVNENLCSTSEMQRANIIRGIIDAELQSKILSEKVLLAAKTRSPYGYTRHANKLIKNDDEYTILEKLIASKNIPPLIAKLNKTGTTKRGKFWTIGNVQHAIREHHKLGVAQRS